MMAPHDAQPGRNTARWIAVVAAVLSLAYVGSQLRPPSHDAALDYNAFGRIPVSADGRVKPTDTAARTNLLIFSDRQTWRDSEGNKRPAIEWFADVLARQEAAAEYPIFRIDDPDVLSLLDLDENEGPRYSFATLIERGDVISDQAVRARQVPDKQRNRFQRHLLEVHDAMIRYLQLSRLQRPYAVPPLNPDEQWAPLATIVEQIHATGEPNEAVSHLAGILKAYSAEDAEDFNQRVGNYLQLLDEHLPGEVRRAQHEVWFNRIQPFYRGIILYLGAFVLLCLSALASAWENSRLSKRLWLAAMGVLAAAFLVHTLGLAARVYLQGRPPVTNLYSSAVFIGWVCLILGLFIEWLYRNGLGAMLAALIGFATLIVAHNLADGDTMQMMQAVLDSNFWLSTHVVAITIGYSATFLAGFLGIAYIFTGVYTRQLTPERVRSMGKMLYGVIAFALLMSFVGTVLGGIWADQSWGRFWGWDPKENGAVLIVLITALILHARWGGMIQTRGVAVLAVGGNIVTAWSWFGTNMLGVGLHSYGFMDAAMMWLMAFIASQLAIMAVGLLPVRRWASFESLAAARAQRQAMTAAAQPSSPY